MDALPGVAVVELVAANDPLSGWEWDCGRNSRASVDEAVREGRLQLLSWHQAVHILPIRNLSKQDWPRLHAERVAYLVLHPDPSPIEISLGPFDADGPSPAPKVVDGYRVRIDDGAHRLAAASIRGDLRIGVTLGTGTRYYGKHDLRKLLPSITGREFPPVPRFWR